MRLDCVQLVLSLQPQRRCTIVADQGIGIEKCWSCRNVALEVKMMNQIDWNRCPWYRIPIIPFQLYQVQSSTNFLTNLHKYA